MNSSTIGIFGLNMSFEALKLALTITELDKKLKVNNVRITFLTHIVISSSKNQISQWLKTMSFHSKIIYLSSKLYVYLMHIKLKRHTVNLL